MRCSKCNKWLPLITKSCPKCGTAVSPEIKKKAWLEFLGLFLFALLAAFIYPGLFNQMIGGVADPTNTQSNFVHGLILSTLLFSIILYLLASFFKFLIRRPILGVILLVILIVTPIVIIYSAGGSNYKKAKELLPVFQDSLAEAAAAKIMGDSIKFGHPTPRASMEKVKSSAQTVVDRLADITAPVMLNSYQQKAIDWSNKIIAAAKGTASWNELANQPGDFNLRISDNQAKELFSASIKNIQILKEFGDNAIKKKDRDAMRYVAAKLLVQNHWLNGILHSKNTGLFAINFTSSVFASNQDPMQVPDIGPAEDVTCSICNNPSYHMTADQRRMYGCDTKCQPQQKQTQPAQQKSEQPAQQPSQNQNQPQTSPGGTNPAGTPPSSKTETANQPQEEFKYGQTIRNICLDITGVAGSYCAQTAEQFTQEIAASAIGFAEGVGGAEEVWNEKWKAESGVGITFGEPSVPTTTKYSPTVQTFYDECGAKGSSVGGANQDKGRLPTTEGGYHCNYKEGANSCWSFLTYSGGRYSGGDVGCVEKNLVLVATAEPAPTQGSKTTATPAPKTTKTPTAPPSQSPKSSSEPSKSAGTNSFTPPPVITGLIQSTPWDGIYPISATVNCIRYSSNGPEQKTLTYNFNTEVRDNVIVSAQGKNFVPQNGDVYGVIIANANVRYQFSSVGGRVNVTGVITPINETGWICGPADFSSSRISK